MAVPSQHHVARRHVAVDDLEELAGVVDVVMREVQRAADTAGAVRRDVRRQRLFPLAVRVDQRPQRDALDELHRAERPAVGVPEEVDLHDVAVHEVGRELGLVDEQLQPFRVLGEPLVDDLDGHPLGKSGRAQLLGFVDGRHAAARELAQQAEAGFSAEVGAEVHLGAGAWEEY